MSSTSLPEVLTVPEVCKLLRLSKNTVYEAARKNRIPGMVRVGKVLRFSRDRVLAWIDTGQGALSGSKA